MTAGTRRAIGSLGCVVFLILWIWGAMTLAGYLPKTTWVQLLFFAVAGMGWGVPLFPLIAWANKPD